MPRLLDLNPLPTAHIGHPAATPGVLARNLRTALRVLPLALVLLRAVPARAQSVADLQVMPEALALDIGQRKLVVGSAYDRQGAIVPTASIAYWSSDTTVARVSPDGAVTGVRAGRARIEARSAGRKAAVAVTVRRGPPGPAPTAPAPAAAAVTLLVAPVPVSLLPAESVRLSARLVRADGTPGPDARVTWQSLRPDIAAVDEDGDVIGVAAGETAVQASVAGGLVATVPVAVAAADIGLSTTRLSLAPGDVDTLRATVPAQGGRLIGSGLRWLSSDTSVVHVGSDGAVTARRGGVAEVVVIGLGQERRVRVAVHRRPEIFVLSPRPAAGAVTVPVGGRVTLVARADASDGTPIPEAEIVWEVSDSGLATVDSRTGIVSGIRAGSATVTARLAGFESATWSLDVVTADIALDRPRVGTSVGGRVPLAVRLVDDRGDTVSGSAEVEWSTDRPDVARVSADGTVVGVGLGRATVTAATAWGRRATGEVFVTGDLLFASNRGGRGHGIHQLRISQPDQVVVLLADSGRNVQPALSPDRTRVVFSSDRAGSFDIWIMDADGRNLARLTADAAAEGDPAWAPDGRIVYVAGTGTAGRIVSMRADGTDARVVVAQGVTGGPAVSPDGSQIAFTSARGGIHELYVVDASGTGERRITTTSDRESAPRYAPDGALLFVVHRRAGGSAVVRQPPGAGSNPQVLVDSPDAILSLAVAPDGERIAYVTGRITDRARNRSEYRLQVQAATPNAAPRIIPTRPGEHVISPSF